MYITDINKFQYSYVPTLVLTFFSNVCERSCFSSVARIIAVEYGLAHTSRNLRVFEKYSILITKNLASRMLHTDCTTNLILYLFKTKHPTGYQIKNTIKILLKDLNYNNVENLLLI